VKILILHQHFHTPQTGGALRSYYLAKALSDRGIQTVVITAHNEQGYRQQEVEGVDVHYLPVAYDNKFGFTARGISFLRFAWKSARLAGQWHDVSMCYAMSVPLTVGLAAGWMKRRHKIPFLFEVGDLWPDAPIQLGYVQNYFLRRFLYALEKWIYRQADSIVALSPAIQSAIEKKMPGKTIHLIPNMADVDCYRPAPKEERLEIKSEVQKKFVVTYAGAVGVANGLDYFLEIAHASHKANLPIQFFLCGEGAVLDRLKASAGHCGLGNLTFVGFQNREGVRALLSVSDAAFVCYKNVPVLETGSPNKYFDGLAAGKLIVINFGGWIKKEIEENRCGIYVDPREPNDFVKKIRPFVEDKNRLLEYQDAARRLGMTTYSRDMLSAKFADLFIKR
jgi:glycosyltransferase involved in cell wall biosynthesis